MTTSVKRGSRQQQRQARQLALQWLYAYECKHYEDDGFLLPSASGGNNDDNDDDFVQPKEAVSQTALQLCEGFCAERVAVDAAVDERLSNWNLSRLAMSERSLLRLGAYELIYHPETPKKVVLNEWIELSKSFGSEPRASKLVNAVLDAIAKDFRK